MILDRFKAYGWMSLALVVSILLGLQTLRLHTEQLEFSSYQVQVAKTQARQAQDLAKATAAARSAQAGLQAAADETRNRTHVQVRSLAAERDALLGRLRDSQARIAALSSTAAAAGTGQAPARDPGAELPARLGEADVREAERADILRLHLAACYAQYERAQAALSAIDSLNPPNPQNLNH